jgi:hypothetical protein
MGYNRPLINYYFKMLGRHFENFCHRFFYVYCVAQYLKYKESGDLDQVLQQDRILISIYWDRKIKTFLILLFHNV